MSGTIVTAGDLPAGIPLVESLLKLNKELRGRLCFGSPDYHGPHLTTRASKPAVERAVVSMFGENKRSADERMFYSAEALRKIPQTDLRGLDLLRWTMNHITEHPELWWPFHTHGISHNLFGWVEVGLYGGVAIADHSRAWGNLGAFRRDTKSSANQLLGIPFWDVLWLSRNKRTLAETYTYVQERLLAPKKELLRSAHGLRGDIAFLPPSVKVPGRLELADVDNLPVEPTPEFAEALKLAPWIHQLTPLP